MAQFTSSKLAGGGTVLGTYIFKPSVAAAVPLTIQGLATSGANDTLFEIKNSAGSSLFSVDNSGNIAFAGTGVITVDQTVTGNLNVYGNTVLGNSSGDTLTVDATSTFNSPVTMASTLRVNGDVTANHNLTVNNTLTANGYSYFNSNLAVAGTFTLNGSLNFGTAAGSVISVTGRMNVLSVSPGLYVYNTVDIDTNSEFIHLYFTGNVAYLEMNRTGTGAGRVMYLIAYNSTSTASSFVQLNGAGAPFVTITGNSAASSSTATLNIWSASSSASSGTPVFLSLNFTVNQSGTAGYTGLYVNMTQTAIGSGTKKPFAIANATVEKFSVDYTGNVLITQTAYDALSPTAFTVTPGAHSALAASTETKDIYLNVGRTVTWATGALATQRFVVVTQPTIAFAGASTVTTTATMCIVGAPITGANATITDSYALWIDAGALRVDGRVLKTQGADVASANNLVLGEDGNTFEITGTTEIQLISNLRWQNGSVVHLLFTGSPTVKHGTATSTTNITILLAGAADFGASAGDTLTLVLSEIGGTQAWRELCRTAI